MSTFASLISYVGEWIQKSYVGQMIVLWWTILFSPLRKQGNSRAAYMTFVSQTFFTGVEALPYIMLLAVVVGALTILQAVTLMPKIGGGGAFGGVMVAVVIRELGPLITALFIAGRTGSAMSTFIGNMTVLQEIDALRAMGISPIYYQIMPAFFATLVSMLCLTIFFNMTAVLGGYLVVWMLKLAIPEIFTATLSFQIFLEKIFEALSLIDGFYAIVKPIIFGMFISVIACYHGLNVMQDIREVPKATRMSVVRSFVAIITSDLLLGIPFLIQAQQKILL